MPTDKVYRFFSAEEKEEMVRKVLAGKRQVDVCHEYGIDKSQLSKLVKKARAKEQSERYERTNRQ